MYNKILNAVLGLLPSGTLVGTMPENNGIACYIGTGSPDEIFLNKGSTNDIFLAVNCKNADQITALSILSGIHTSLSLLKNYPSDNGWEIVDISTSTSPNYIGQEQNSQYLYGSILQIKTYVRGA